MMKTILLTGATDGIGRETAKLLAQKGHRLLLHGRSATKLQALSNELRNANVETYVADLSDLAAVRRLAVAVQAQHTSLDVLINNAGVLKANTPILDNNIDLRFMVNTIAPYLLTKLLLPQLNANSRVINVSSAAQAPVNIQALTNGVQLDDMNAYAQSKLAIMMWTNYLAANALPNSPMLVSVNPGSYLGSKMVKEAFGMQGNDLRIGADILTRAALSEEFETASGKYYDNDSRRFSNPHPHALDSRKCKELVSAIDALI